MLQALLERMENQAGRVVSNELAALACYEDQRGSAEYGAMDEVGRTRLLSLARTFHEQCTRLSREDELLALQWRVQSMEEKRYNPPSVAEAPAASEADAARESLRPAQLRVPTASSPPS